VAGLQVLGEGDDVILVRDVQDAALDTGLGAEQPCDLAGGVRHALVIAASEQDQVVPVHTGRQPFHEGAVQSLLAPVARAIREVFMQTTLGTSPP